MAGHCRERMLASQTSLRAATAAVVVTVVTVMSVVIAVIAVQVMEVLTACGNCGAGCNDVLWQMSKVINCCRHRKPSELRATIILTCIQSIHNFFVRSLNI